MAKLGIEYNRVIIPRISINQNRWIITLEPITLWTPALITTEGWYDPSDTSTITASGITVSQVDDKSGNSRHLEQITESAKPQTGTRTINDLNVICCPEDKWMYYDDFPIPSGDFSIWQVSVIDTIDNGADSIISMYNPAGATWQLNAGSNPPDFDGRIATTAGDNIDFTGGPFPGPSIYNANFDYTDDVEFDGYVDGTNRGSSSYDTQLNTVLDLQIFKNRSGTVYTPEGCFGEVIASYDTSQTTRQLVEGYLAHKWGMYANLPSDHPYRYLVPAIEDWTPSVLSLAAWFDATDTDTITESTSAVSQWDDKSGNDHHLVQGEGANQPTYVSGVVSFDGINDYISNTDTFFAGHIIFVTNWSDGTDINHDMSVISNGVILNNGIYTDFQSLVAGAIDETNVTSPTLSELNNQTFGGDWSFFGAGRGEGFIRDDAAPAGDKALEISTTSTGGLNDWAARLDWDEPVLISSGTQEITFTTAVKRSTGFTRDVYWYICDDTTKLFTLKLDDGVISLDGEAFGDPSGVADAYGVNPWNSEDTNAGKDLVHDVVITINADGSLDVDWNGYTISKPAGYLSTTASVNRLEVNYKLTVGGNGVYFSRVSVAPIYSSTLGISRNGSDSSYSSLSADDYGFNTNEWFINGSYYSETAPITFDETHIVAQPYGGAATDDGIFNTLEVGRTRISGGKYLNGSIGEIIMCQSELSEEDRQKAEGYLAHKWGLTDNLPIDHPYKTSTPIHIYGVPRAKTNYS